MARVRYLRDGRCSKPASMTALQNLIRGGAGTIALAVAAALGPGCGGASDSAGAPQQPTGGYAGKSGGASGPGGRGGTSGFATGGFGGSGTSLPPEKEVESSFEVPVATGRYVWV